VLSLNWFSDSIFAYSASTKVFVIDISTNTLLADINEHNDEINAIEFSYSKLLLATISDDKSARVYSGTDSWSNADKKSLYTLRHNGRVTVLKWSPSEKLGDRYLAT
jgi:WD40 repeat protein